MVNILLFFTKKTSQAEDIAAARPLSTFSIGSRGSKCRKIQIIRFVKGMRGAKPLRRVQVIRRSAPQAARALSVFLPEYLGKRHRVFVVSHKLWMLGAIKLGGIFMRCRSACGFTAVKRYLKQVV